VNDVRIAPVDISSSSTALTAAAPRTPTGSACWPATKPAAARGIPGMHRPRRRLRRHLCHL